MASPHFEMRPFQSISPEACRLVVNPTAIEPLIKARKVIKEEIGNLDRKVMKLARHDLQGRAFMTRDADRVIAVALVDLHLEHRFALSRVDADDNQFRAADAGNAARRQRLDDPHVHSCIRQLGQAFAGGAVLTTADARQTGSNSWSYSCLDPYVWIDVVCKHAWQAISH